MLETNTTAHDPEFIEKVFEMRMEIDECDTEE